MAADYTTQAVVLRGPLVGNIMRVQAPPAGTVAMGLNLPGIGLVIIALGDLRDGTSSGGGTATVIALPVSLDVLQALPTTHDVDVNVQYTCSDDRWNAGTGGTVSVLGLNPDAYWPVGIGLVNGAPQLVSIDVAAATYVPFAGGGALTQTNVADVPAAKRIQVVRDIAASVANGGQAMVLELDNTLAGKFFKDPRSPAAPYKYEALQESNPSTGTTEVWWNRFRIQ